MLKADISGPGMPIYFYWLNRGTSDSVDVKLNVQVEKVKKKKESRNEELVNVVQYKVITWVCYVYMLYALCVSVMCHWLEQDNVNNWHFSSAKLWPFKNAVDYNGKFHWQCMVTNHKWLVKYVYIMQSHIWMFKRCEMRKKILNLGLEQWARHTGEDMLPECDSCESH